MKKNYTQFIKGILTLMVGVLCIGSVSAQYTITVGETEYELRQGAIGTNDGLALSAVMTVVDNSCAAIAGIDGTIVLADRSTDCLPWTQAQNAQDGGAVAVIICNTIAADLEFIDFEYDSNDEVIGGENITFPVYNASVETCTELKVAAGSEGTLELLVPECNRDIPVGAVWGLNGEGEFGGGLNGWTVDNEDGFQYDAKGKVDKGGYGSNQGQIVSPTLCNGAMVADTDYGDNEGVPGNFENGICPVPTGSFCETSLTSPSIDLSNVVGGTTIQFYQAVRQFQSNFFLELSIDDGATWPAGMSFPINDDMSATSPVRRDIYTQTVFGIAGEANVKFRLRYEGNYYFWAVDDFFITEGNVSDARLNEGFIAQVPSFRTPASQSDIIALLADLENVGNIESEDVVLTATLTDDSSGAQLAQTSLDYGTIAGGYVDQNRLFPETLNMPSDVGAYKLTYAMSSSNDEVADNNEYSLNFEITENRFAKCNPDVVTGGGVWFGADNAFGTFGNAYHIVTGTNDNGEQLYLDNVRVGVSDFSSGGRINIAFYQWIDNNNDQFVGGEGEAGGLERFLLGEETILIFDGSGNVSNNMVFDLRDPSGDLIPLSSNSNYIVATSVIPNDGTTAGFSWPAIGPGDDPDYNYNATNLAFGPGNPTGFLLDENGMQVLSSQGNPISVSITDNPLNMTRVGSVGGQSANGEEHVRGLFASSYTVIAEMTIGTEGDITGTEDINENIGVSVFPNPASDKITVALQLENLSANVNLQVVDAQGRIVKSQNYSHVKESNLGMDIKDLNTGMYMINIRTAEGFTSTRFVKD